MSSSGLMRRYLISAVALFYVITFASHANAVRWFDDATPLTQAHQKLLNNDLQGSFAAMVQVWQAGTDEHTRTHLNQLLLKSLEKDCGKSLTDEPIAPWLEHVIVRRQSLQSPGRRLEKVILEVSSRVELQSFRFTSWPDSSVSNESHINLVSEERPYTYQVRYDLTKRLPIGLYRIQIKDKANRSWESWIVLGETSAKEVVRWESKDSWMVEHNGQLNPYCSIPILGVSLYDYIDNEYVRVWNREYEGRKYPKTLPLETLPPSRYVLAVSITHQRWQGLVSIQDQQIISKTYDITAQ